MAASNVACGFCLMKNEKMFEPKRLACGHIHCSTCLIGLMEAYKVVECPSPGCKQVYSEDIQQLPDVDLSVETSQEICDLCKEAAIVYCTHDHCRKRFCQKHKQLHAEFHNDHDIIGIKERRPHPAKQETIGCEVHEGQELMAGCRRCSHFLCLQCLEDDTACQGVPHKMATIKTLFGEAKETLTSLRDRVEERKTGLVSVIKQSEEKLSQHKEEMQGKKKSLEEAQEEELRKIKQKYAAKMEALQKEYNENEAKLVKFRDEKVEVEISDLTREAQMITVTLNRAHRIDVIAKSRESKSRLTSVIDSQLPSWDDLDQTSPNGDSSTKRTTTFRAADNMQWHRNHPPPPEFITESLSGDELAESAFIDEEKTNTVDQSKAAGESMSAAGPVIMKTFSSQQEPPTEEEIAEIEGNSFLQKSAAVPNSPETSQEDRTNPEPDTTLIINGRLPVSSSASSSTPTVSGVMTASPSETSPGYTTEKHFSRISFEFMTTVLKEKFNEEVKNKFSGEITLKAGTKGKHMILVNIRSSTREQSEGMMKALNALYLETVDKLQRNIIKVQYDGDKSKLAEALIEELPQKYPDEKFIARLVTDEEIRIVGYLENFQHAKHVVERFVSEYKEKLPATQQSSPNTSDITLSNGAVVKVIEGDLTGMKSDAVVSSSGPNLSHKSGVSKAIALACGQKFVSEGRRHVDTHGLLSTGQTFTQPAAGKLKQLYEVSYVIHAIAPSPTQPEDISEPIIKTVLNALTEADTLKCKSVALPAICSGRFDVPINTCASCYWLAMEMFAAQVQLPSLMEINFVVDDGETVLNINRAFREQSQ